MVAQRSVLHHHADLLLSAARPTTRSRLISCARQSMVTNFALLFLVVGLATSRTGLCQFDDYNVNDLDKYQIYEGGYDAIEDNAVGTTYYDPYTEDYGDPYADDLWDDLKPIADCKTAADGSASFNGTKPCDVQLQGVDKAATNLPGGMDGVYKLLTCENGRPLYIRDTKDKTAERVLWFSKNHQDWDITNGSIPHEDDVLLYGGHDGVQTRPQQVTTAWHIAAEFLPNYDTAKSQEYTELNLTVKCVEGSAEETQQQAPAAQRYKPLLTDEEQDAQYMAVIKQGRQDLDASGGLNSGLIVMFVGAGLGIVVGLPFMIAQRKGTRKGDKGISLTSLKDMFTGKQAHSS